MAFPDKSLSDISIGEPVEEPRPEQKVHTPPPPKEPAREPEPVPLFSCIYCAREYLVFTRFSNKLLSTKYQRCPFDPELLLARLDPPLGSNTASILGPGHNWRDEKQISFGMSGELDIAWPSKQSEAGEQRPSLVDLQLLANMEAAKLECSNNQQGAQPEIREEKGGAAPGFGETVRIYAQRFYVPAIAGRSRELHWIMQKFYISRKSKEKAGANTLLFDKSASSYNACSLRSGIVNKNTQSVVKKAEILPMGLSVDFGVQKRRNESFGFGFEERKPPAKIDLSDLSFSSSEHDIYHPNFDSESESSDGEFIAEALSRSAALKLSRTELPESFALLQDGSVPNSAMAERGPVVIVDSDIDEEVKTNRIYSSQTNVNSNGRQFLTRATMIVQNASLVGSPSHAMSGEHYDTVDYGIRSSMIAFMQSRKESDANSPSLIQHNMINSNSASYVCGQEPKQVASLPPMQKCTSARQLPKTRNPATSMQESKTGYGLRKPQVKTRPRPPAKKAISTNRTNPSLRGTRQQLSKRQRELHYESVIAKNKSGIPIPIFIRSVIETPLAAPQRRPTTSARTAASHGKSGGSTLAPPRYAVQAAGKRAAVLRRDSKPAVASPNVTRGIQSMASHNLKPSSAGRSLAGHRQHLRTEIASPQKVVRIDAVSPAKRS